MANLKVTENPVAFMPFTEHVDPSNPSAGDQRLFVDTDHLLKMVDSSGTVTTFSTAAGGAVATDPIWDAAGDLAVGSGANTAAKLAMGAAGGHVSRINGAVAWNSGTSFPTAATGDRYWRTDLGMEFYYDGTRWVTVQMFTAVNGHQNPTSTTTYQPVTNTQGSFVIPAPYLAGCSDVWLVGLRTMFFVASGGTALGASHKWVITFGKTIAANTVTTLLTVNVDSGSSAVWRDDVQSIGALLNNGTTHYNFSASVTKTGTPGSFYALYSLGYRLVAT